MATVEERLATIEAEQKNADRRLSTIERLLYGILFAIMVAALGQWAPIFFKGAGGG